MSHNAYLLSVSCIIYKDATRFRVKLQHLFKNVLFQRLLRKMFEFWVLPGLHFSFSKFFTALSSTWKKDVWSKRDAGPTYLGQWNPCAQILNPHRCRREGWTVGKNNLRTSCLYPGIDSAFVTAPCPTPQVVSGSQNNVLLNVSNAICIRLVATKNKKNNQTNTPKTLKTFGA